MAAPKAHRDREIGPGELAGMLRRRASLIAFAMLGGTAAGVAYTLAVSGSWRDPVAGALAAMITAATLAGLFEWLPRPAGTAGGRAEIPETGERRDSERTTIRLGRPGPLASFALGAFAGLFVGLVVSIAVDGRPFGASSATNPPAPDRAGPSTFLTVDLRNCLNGEISTTGGSYWRQTDPTGAVGIFVASHRRLQGTRRWDNPRPARRVTIFVYEDPAAAAAAKKAVRKTFAEVGSVERHGRVLVGRRGATKPSVARPLAQCLGAPK